MKKLIYDSVLLLLGCLLWTACNNDEDLTVFSTEGAKTELGQKIIAGSDGYVGQYFSDSTYTLAPGITDDRHGMMIVNNEHIIEIIKNGEA